MKGFTVEKIGMLILGTLAAICIYVALTDSGCPHSKNTPTALDVSLVKKMREAQKVYSEQFPTGFRCYAPIELEEKVDEYLKKMHK